MSFCDLPVSARLKHSFPCLSTQALGSQTQGLVLAWQTFYKLNHLPKPSSLSIQYLLTGD